MIRLYDYWRSSASYRVRIALGLAGLSWDTVPIDLVAGAQRSADHLERNPQGLVPVLEIDGLRLTQSVAIVEYLDETRGLGLLPADPVGRARVRALSHAIAMDLHPVCNLRVARHAVDQSGGAVTMEGWMQHFITPALQAFEAELEGGDYCYDAAVSLADICLMPQLYNARRWGVDLSPLSKLRRIEGALADHPAFAAAHPDRTPH
ncbi:maleylacetoacetate isomerase [Donghicola tyrosinivorans]|uniref:Maleylacetoacetate isomerase n=1 Tax=Donghicola tyrosinivorans TaxID=1652492 RepID=A0A2T0WNP6_9RHOB|nr:maleylacetoacetate isomerase [Donghicola tyrosinivorans]PRY88319.1 maleylacetoacetate isomerase [Donghicola tyrosinivorans]